MRRKSTLGLKATYLFLLVVCAVTVSQNTQAQTTLISSQDAHNTAFCPGLTQTLYYGESDAQSLPTGQVSALQRFLIEYYKLPPATMKKGVFDRATSRLVLSFQKEVGLPTVGTVGPKTRAKIAGLCGKKDVVTTFSLDNRAASAVIISTSTTSNTQTNTNVITITPSSTTNVIQIPATNNIVTSSVSNTLSQNSTNGSFPNISSIQSKTDFVKHLYTCVLGRTNYADWEITSWVNAKFTANLVYNAFYTASNQLTDTGVTNEQYVSNLYKCVLFRAGDAPGVAAQLSALQNGFTRTQLLAAFLNSSEFLTSIYPAIKNFSSNESSANAQCASTAIDVPVYIVAGQSNEVGAGKISDTLNQSFWSYWNTNGYNFDMWSVGSASVNSTSWQSGSLISHQFPAENEQLFGPELGLAYKLQQSSTGKFYIFKAAWGSSSLSPSGTNSNVWLSRGQGGHYDEMVAAYKRAAAALCQSGYRPVVKGFYWMQGESDSGPDLSGAYKAVLTTLIDQTYEDMLSPSTQFIVGKVKQHLEPASIFPADYFNTVRSAQESLDGYRAIVSVIETNSFSSYGGDCSLTIFCFLHFNSDGLLQMGYAVYNALLQRSR